MPLHRRSLPHPVAQLCDASRRVAGARTCARLVGVPLLLVSRLHVDLQRVSSAVCRPAR